MADALPAIEERKRRRASTSRSQLQPLDRRAAVRRDRAPARQRLGMEDADRYHAPDRHGRARASAPGTSAGLNMTSSATPTTTSARAWPAASWSSARPTAARLRGARHRDHRQHLPVRRDRRTAVRRGARRRALRGAQLGARRGRRGRGRSLLRVHDRRRRRRARDARASTSAPA